MADPALKISAELTGLEKSAQRALRNIEKNTRIRIQVDDRASAPLGRISKSASEIEDSLDAATSRVVAFGAAAAVFTGIAKTFDTLVTSIVEVEDALARINVNFGATQSQLQSFSKEVFNAARNTAKTFDEAAKAAEELARQGLGTDETIKRLNNALILSRRAGIDSAEAVNTLTAAYNSFASAGLDTSQIINKLVAVDTRFAVSTKDLSEAISRAASTAQEAGLSFDEFLGIVTSVQQTTARGGAVIGNALKTIFTRVQAAPETIKALEDLGVAITDSSGAFTTAGERLRQYAQIRQTLSEGDKAYYDRIISGTQQINILTAALNDLGKANGVAAQAQQISLQATNEAIVQNEELNKTLKSVLSQTGTGIFEIFSKIGQDAGENIKKVLVSFNDIINFINENEKIIQGFANVLTGPALAAAGVLLVSVFADIFSNLQKSLGTVLGLDRATKVRLDIEKQIAVVTSNATSEELKRLNAATSLAERRAAYLAIEQRVTAELLRQSALSSSLAQSLAPNRPPLQGIFSGFPQTLYTKKTPPNFADPLRTAIQREIDSGVPKSSIYVDTDPRLKSPSNPKGLLVANRIDEPLGGFQGVNNALREGRNPKKNGFVPNFAEFDDLQFFAGSKPTGFTDFNLPKDRAKELRRLFIKFRQSRSLDEIKDLESQIRGFVSSNKLTPTSAKEVQLKLESQLARIEQSKKIFRSGVNRFGQSSIGPNIPGQIQVGEGGQRGSFEPEDRIQGAEKAGRRAASLLRKEKRIFETEALKKNAFDLLSQGVLPSEKEISAVRTEVERDAIRKLQSDPRFSKFIGSSGLTKDAPDELVDLFDNRVRRSLSSFEVALSKARQRVIDNKNTEKIKSAFEGRRIGFFDSGDRKIAEELFSKGGITPRNRELVQSILAERDQRRFQRRQTATLGAAFALPFAAGFIPEGTGGTTGGIAGGLASGALQGAGLGGLFGPVGLAVGAAVGGLVGVFNKLEKSSEELAKSFEKENSFRQESLSGLKAFTSLQEELQQAIKIGDIKSVERLNKQSADIAKQVEPEILKRFREGGGLESLRQSESQRQRELDSRLAQQQAEILFKEGFFGSSLSNERALDVSNLARVFNIVGGSGLAGVTDSFNQTRLSQIERFGAATPGNSRNADVIGTIKFVSDELAKLPQELRPNVKVTANNISELARFLRELAKASKQVSTSTKEEIKTAEDRLALAKANKIRGTFVGFGAEEATAFSGFARGARGFSPRFDQNELLASVLEIIEKRSGRLPKSLEIIGERVEGERGFRGSLEALNSLVSGLTDLNFKLPSGNFDTQGLLRISGRLQNQKNINQDARQILSFLSEQITIKQAGGFGPKQETFSVFAPGGSIVNPGNVLKLGGGALSPSSKFDPKNTIIFGGGNLPPSSNKLGFGSQISMNGSLLPISTETEEEAKKRKGILISSEKLDTPPLPEISPELKAAKELAEQTSRNIRDLSNITEENRAVVADIVRAVKDGIKIDVALKTIYEVLADPSIADKIEDIDSLKAELEGLRKRTIENEKKTGVIRPPIANSRGRTR